MSFTGSDSTLQSLAASPPSVLGPALAAAQTAQGGIQKGEKTALAASFPTIQKPTGLPTGRRPAKPQRKSSKGEAPRFENGAEGPAKSYETTKEVSQGPLPASGAPAAVAEQASEDEGSWWSWLTNRIRGFLNRIPTSDPGLSTSAGEHPKVDLSGAADPSHLGEHEQVSTTAVRSKQREADQATTADFGENNIAPDVQPGTLRSKYRPAPLKGTAVPSKKASVSSAFDRIVGPSVRDQIRAENQKYGEAKSQHQTDSAALREESTRRIQEEDSRTRMDQITMRQEAREQVNAARQEWRDANARVARDFNDGAQAKRKEAETQIDTKVADTERQTDVELTRAETESQQEKVEAEKKAAEEKRKAEEQPKSWWQRFKGAVSSAFSAIRDAVNGIFEAVRAKVKQIIQAAKKLVRGLIEAARSAIVGLIRVFGEALKGLVTIALAAFPEAADRAGEWIDEKVNSAVQGVNQAAEALKKAADEALDWLGEQLDKLLAKLQAVFDAVLGAIATIVDLLLSLDELWARIVAKLREAAPVPPDMAGVLQFFKDLRESILGPAAPAKSRAAPVSKTPQVARACCTSCENQEKLQRKTLEISRDLKPPGNCIQGIHDEMQRLVKAWCDHPSGRTCTPGESCNRLRQKIRRNQLCAQYRRDINDKCYDGGDLGHRIAEQDARRAQANCMALYRAQCEKKVPDPVRVPKEVPESAWERFKRFMRENEKALAIGAIAAVIVGVVLALIPEPVATKILAFLSLTAAATAFIVLYVKFKDWDSQNGPEA